MLNKKLTETILYNQEYESTGKAQYFPVRLISFFYHFRPMFRLFTYIIILPSIILSDVNRQILKSDSKELVIEYNINAETESDLYPISLLMGLPTQDFPHQ